MKKRRKGGKKSKITSIMFYSLRDLPYSFRAMPGFKNPHIPSSIEAIELLSSMGVFFYRDDLDPAGVFIEQQPLKAVTEGKCINPDETFKAYVYQASVEQDAQGLIQIRTRELGEAYGPVALRLKKLRFEKYGDALWWDRWAHEVSIIHVTTHVVQCR